MATRIRRGKEVEIPEKWVGKFPTKKTMRDRKSNMTKGQREACKPAGAKYKEQKQLLAVDEE